MSWFGTCNTPRMWWAFIIVMSMWGLPFLVMMISERFYPSELLTKISAWTHFSANILLLFGLPFSFRINPVIGRLSLIVLLLSFLLAMVALGD